MKARKRLDVGRFAILTSNLSYITKSLFLKVDEDESPIHLIEETPCPFERAQEDWVDNMGDSDDSSEVGKHSLASISVVPESVEEGIVSDKLPIVVLSPKPNPKEPTSNDEVLSGKFEFHRLRRAKVYSKDNWEELFNSDTEVDNQRLEGRSHSTNSHSTNTVHPPQEWVANDDLLGPSLEA
ncbi:hypothetical protein Ancab_006088 [Ancistrocladus abbreviatus]